MLVGTDGAERTVLSISQEFRSGFPVVNLTIEGEHTFAVGPDAVLVHNTAHCGPRASQIATATTKQLQKKFKHASDFGVTGNPTKANLSKFRQGIQDHLNNPATKQINGSFRGKPAIINVDPNTGLAVIRNLNGGFVSGWRLSADQLKHVLSSGKLGGG